MDAYRSMPGSFEPTLEVDTPVEPTAELQQQAQQVPEATAAAVGSHMQVAGDGIGQKDLTVGPVQEEPAIETGLEEQAVEGDVESECEVVDTVCSGSEASWDKIEGEGA